LTADEVTRLLRQTMSSGTRHGLTGIERGLLYRIAIETGLRRSEILSLRTTSFFLTSAPPTVTVEAASAKNRRKKALPLRPSTAQEVERLLKRRPPQTAVFPLSASWRSGEMLRADLDDADIAYKDARGNVVDFHALRHTCVTLLADANVHPSVVQQL